MDKVGPIVRSVEDAALVFNFIHGADGKDPTVFNKPFSWPGQSDLTNMRVGYVESRRTPDDEREDLNSLKQLGVKLVKVELPTMKNMRNMFNIINIEGASVFEEMFETK